MSQTEPPDISWRAKHYHLPSLQDATCAQVFSDIYEAGCWRLGKSISGPGSDREAAAFVRQELPELCRRMSFRTLLDAPCGDLNWLSDLDLPIDSYFGVDIVPELISTNLREYRTGMRQFACLDIRHDALVQVDLILCRDLLVHLSFQDALLAWRNMIASGSRYILLTHYSFREDELNNDVRTGDWRPLDLLLPPFSFPPPLLTLKDGPDDRTSDDFGKTLALWSLSNMQMYFA